MINSKLLFLATAITFMVCAPAPAPSPPKSLDVERPEPDPEPGDSTGTTRGLDIEPTQPPGELPPGMRWVCHIEGQGELCRPADCTGPECTEGVLCCIKGVCVLWEGGTCSGDLAWCWNWSESTGSSGVPQATCHDGAT